ncbi:MAG: DUF3526 domain-containing protein [Bryobacteraceae bacterium]|nr:DUF3526 domain-containing protein [Bryobacteraceae bacterium]
MITTIARKEIKEMTRDGRFRGAAVIVLGLLIAAVGMGWRQHVDVERQHAAAQQETRQNWLTQGEKNPHSAAHYGVYAFKPKMALSLVDRGIDPYTGVAVWLEAHKQNDFKYRPAQDANTLARFGELTAATVLQVLAPLLIVLFSFAAFAGERENGTLRQLLSLGLTPGQLAGGKALGVAAALGMLLTPAALIGAFVLTNDLPRMLLLALFYLLYFGAFVGVALAISAWAKSTRTALVGLLAFWIFNALIAPRAAADLSKRWYPTPSSQEFASQMQKALTEGGGEEELKAKVLKQYNVSRIEDLPVNWTGITLTASEKHGDEVYDRFYGQLWDQFEQQIRFQEASALVAPLLSVRSLSMGLAGTDFQQHRHFAVAAEKYRRYFIQVMNDDITKNAAKTGAYLRKDDLWAQVKDFEYTLPSIGWVLSQHTVALSMLVAWCLGGAMLAYLATSRLRVE